MAYYAWSQINYAADVDKDTGSRTVKSVKHGEEVTAQKLGLNKDQFQELVDSGAVRDRKFPDLPEGYTGTPREFFLKQAKETDEYQQTTGGSIFAEEPV